jgi:predicted O-methyltransferase YrrM
MSRILKRMTRCWSASDGTVVPLRSLTNVPRSLASALSRRILGRYPEVPFIPYSAIELLEQTISAGSSIVEVGAGYSTVWFARRSRHVRSLEWNAKWFSTITNELRARGLVAEVRHTEGHREMHFSSIADASLDVVFIDGGPRAMCFANLWPKLKPGGACYLDNWDVRKYWTETLDAYAFLDSIATEISDQRICVDYVPGMFCVETGLMIWKK